MPKIRILPEILSNKIAAGEVVERPASVVKELCENALDAQSSQIVIEIEKGGKSLVRVSDNGSGMTNDDALLAIERYATSKLVTDEDLFSISTLGFRGEALPSIASVCKMSLVTRNAETPSGCKIDISGGKIRNVIEAGAPVGTMVSCTDLFFNTPARRKFLKTVTTEMGHITDVVHGMAMGWPSVGFTLIHNKKVLFQLPPTTDSAHRISTILCNGQAETLIPLSSHSPFARVSGFIAPPDVTKSTGRSMYSYINGRAAKDRLVTHAVLQGYGNRLMKGRYPVAVIFVETDFDQVDVNVHPTKAQVRFVHPNRVHDTIAKAVSQALDDEGSLRWSITKNEPEMPAFTQSRPRSSQTSLFSYREKKEKGTGWVSEPSPCGTSTSPQQNIAPPFSEIGNQPVEKLPAPGDDAVRSPWKSPDQGALHFIGQLDKTYLLCESQQGLVVVDQHAAHERILYEQILSQMQNGEISIQRLLIPESLETSSAEADILSKLASQLNQMGLEIERFSGNTFIMKSAPSFLSDRPLKPLLEDILEKVKDKSGSVDQVTEQCAALMACHGAIRAHEILAVQDVTRLLTQLSLCKNPSQCPHGRPTWISWNKADIAKSFKR